MKKTDDKPTLIKKTSGRSSRRTNQSKIERINKSDKPANVLTIQCDTSTITLEGYDEIMEFKKKLQATKYTETWDLIGNYLWMFASKIKYPDWGPEQPSATLNVNENIFSFLNSLNE